MTPRAQLKRKTGWFAAGREVECALKILPDFAFKVYIWLSLKAFRRSGEVRVTPGELASALDRTEDDIRAAFGELVQCGICYPPLAGFITIADEFWPYERNTSPAQGEKAELSKYILEVKNVFLARRCVQSTFGTADVKFATELYDRGVSVGTVENSIFLGSLRKYLALMNNEGGTPITSLRYFGGLIDEVQQVISQDYLKHVAQKAIALERRWYAYEDIFRGDGQSG